MGKLSQGKWVYFKEILLFTNKAVFFSGKLCKFVALHNPYSITLIMCLPTKLYPVWLQNHLSNKVLFCVVVCLALFCLLQSCSDPKAEQERLRALFLQKQDSLRAIRTADSLRKLRRAKEAQQRVPEIRYYQAVIDSKNLLDSIRRTFSKSKFNAYRVFTTINRKDLQYFRLGDTVVLPQKIEEDLKLYSLFPHFYPAADTIPKLILVSNALQAYACYEKGQLIRFSACNTGEEKKPTFPGRYALNWRDKLRRSSIDSSWILPWTWNIHLQAGSAFHQFDMPGRPVSHSCIRQFETDAEWLFRWGKQGAIDTANKKYIPFTGTPVIIIDHFDFRRKKGGPWLNLSSNKDTILPVPSNPMGAEEALIPISQIPPEVRWSLPDKARYVKAEDSLRKRGIIRAGVELKESVNFNRERRLKQKAKLLAAAKLKKVQLRQQATTISAELLKVTTEDGRDNNPAEAQVFGKVLRGEQAKTLKKRSLSKKEKKNKGGKKSKLKAKKLAGYALPVLPNPPLPRSVVSKPSTRVN